MQLVEPVYVTCNNTGPMSEQGDSSSAEEVESPRSVVTAAAARKSGGVGGRWRRWRKRCANSNNSNSNNNNNNNNNNNSIQKEKSYLHSQVLRVKEEELQIGEYLMGGFGIYNINYVPDSIPLVVDDGYDDVSKMVLPASPLGSKKNY